MMNRAQLCLVSLELTGYPHWSPEKQLRCLYSLSNYSERHYHQLKLHKRRGGVRHIQVPDLLLKRVQQQILRQVLAKLPVSSHATAWRTGYGLSDNVLPHVGQKQVLKLDIQNFFPSIIFPQVHQATFARTDLPLAATTLLSHLCCYHDRLPQGAPTSPAIANLVMRPFDDFIGAYCRERGMAYTRYGDDLAFSGDFDAQQVQRRVRSFLADMGFTLNSDKTRLMGRGQRQIVTGIVVNGPYPQVPRETRRALRQTVYYYGKYGIASQPDAIAEERWLLSLLGKIQFILQINPTDDEFVQWRNQVQSWLVRFG